LRAATIRSAPFTTRRRSVTFSSLNRLGMMRDVDQPRTQPVLEEISPSEAGGYLLQEQVLLAYSAGMKT
jgi:hypothetical protein